jgi:hypothetical protein
VPIFTSLVIYLCSKRQAKTVKNQFQFRFEKKEQGRGGKEETEKE